MESSTDKFFVKPRTLAMFSVGSGFASLISIFSPPAGLFMGASAIFFAALSKMTGGKFSGFSIAGLILGIFGVLLSIMLFVNFMMVIRILDDPDGLLKNINDPALAAQIKEIIRQYTDMLRSLR